MIIWKWKKHKWLEIGTLKTLTTKYSDHKAFIIQLYIDKDITPTKGNIRNRIDIKDRFQKNMQLIENMTNMRENYRKLQQKHATQINKNK